MNAYELAVTSEEEENQFEEISDVAVNLNKESINLLWLSNQPLSLSKKKEGSFLNILLCFHSLYFLRDRGGANNHRRLIDIFSEFTTNLPLSSNWQVIWFFLRTYSQFGSFFKDTIKCLICILKTPQKHQSVKIWQKKTYPLRLTFPAGLSLFL